MKSLEIHQAIRDDPKLLAAAERLANALDFNFGDKADEVSVSMRRNPDPDKTGTIDFTLSDFSGSVNWTFGPDTFALDNGWFGVQVRRPWKALLQKRHDYFNRRFDEWLAQQEAGVEG